MKPDNPNKRGFLFLFRKGDRSSKTAFWLGMVMMATIALLWVVVIRMAWIPDEYFVQSLVGGGAFFTLINLLIARLYHKGKTKPPSGDDHISGGGNPFGGINGGGYI